MSNNYYTRHVFFCINQRQQGSGCGDYAALDLQQYAKSRLKELDLWGKTKIRINRAGCLGRCAEGPVIVVYPEGIWYTYIDRKDIDEIIERHLIKGETVDRLLI